MAHPRRCHRHQSPPPPQSPHHRHPRPPRTRRPHLPDLRLMIRN